MIDRYFVRKVEHIPCYYVFSYEKNIGVEVKFRMIYQKTYNRIYCTLPFQFMMMKAVN